MPLFGFLSSSNKKPSPLTSSHLPNVKKPTSLKKKSPAKARAPVPQGSDNQSVSSGSVYIDNAAGYEGLFHTEVFKSADNNTDATFPTCMSGPSSVASADLTEPRGNTRPSSPIVHPKRGLARSTRHPEEASPIVESKEQPPRRLFPFAMRRPAPEPQCREVAHDYPDFIYVFHFINPWRTTV